MRYKPLSLIMLGLAVSACQVGPTVETFKPAHDPEGVRMTLELNKDLVPGDELEGELLEVRVDGLLLNVAPAPGAESDARRVWSVSYSQVKRMKMAQRTGWVYEVDARKREKLTLLSRFPQGLSPELLEALLSSQNQDAIITVGQ